MAQDNTARILLACRVRNEEATWTRPPKDAPSVQPYSQLFDTVDDEDITQPLPAIEDCSGIRPVPRGVFTDEPDQPAARSAPSSFPPELDYDARAAATSIWDLEPRPRFHEDPAPLALPPTPFSTMRPLLETGVGRHSGSNFYTGFDPVIHTGGVFVATHRHMALGAQVAVRVFLAGEHRLDLEGHVHWTREWHTTEIPAGIGVRVEPLSDRAAELAKRFMRMREPLFYPDC